MAPRSTRLTAGDLLRVLQRDGWDVLRQSGSHVQLRHPEKPGRVTVAYHSGVVLKPKTLARALEQAELTVDDLRRLL